MKYLSLSLISILFLSACINQSVNQKPKKQVGGHSYEAFISAYDTNNDGKVTKSEYFKIRKQRFKKADTNKDGWLSREEYISDFKNRFMQDGRLINEDKFDKFLTQAHARFDIIDINKDSKISWEEELIIAEKTFNDFDKNKDEIVDVKDK